MEIATFSDYIAHFFLFFTHVSFIIPLIIIGYIGLDKKIFLHAVFLIVLSILFNKVLKSIFQVPLSPALGKEGFAFPRPHSSMKCND